MSKNIKTLVIVGIGLAVIFAVSIKPEPFGLGGEVVMTATTTIEQKLEGKTTKEKANVKGREIAKVDFRGMYISQEYGVRLDIQSIVAIEGGVEVLARAWQLLGEKQYGFGKDGSVEIEKFRIYNPPVMVYDTNGSVVREWTAIDDDDKQIQRQLRLREDPAQAIRDSLSHTVTLVGKLDTDIVQGKTGNTTSTFYPAAGANEPVDGTPSNNEGTASTFSFNQVRDEADGNSANDTANLNNAVFLRSAATTDKWRLFQRGIYGFDTSAIDDGDTVDSGTFSLFGNDSDDAYSQSVVLDRSVPISTNGLVVGDYNITRYDLVEQATARITIAAWSDIAYNDFTLNATGKGNISVTGLSWFATIDSAEFDDTSPTWQSGDVLSKVEVFYADETGTTKDPKLVIVHSAGATEEVSNSQGYLIGI